jgi:hypothetical protein
MTDRSADIPAERRRPRARHAVAGLAVAALAALVLIALGASEAGPGPDRGDFAAAAAEPAVTLPGAAPRAPGAAALELHVGGHRLTALSVHSRLPCADGPAVDDDVAIALPDGPWVAGCGAFTVRTAAVRVEGRFVGADRAIGTLTHTVGPCALQRARWTARRAG